MKAKNSVKIEFLSRSVNEGFARTALASFVAQLDPTIDEIADIKTAISEAVTNCVVHAYANTLGRVVITARSYENGKIVVSIKDFGCGIENVEQALEPLYTTDHTGERSGMGFPIMESLMDTLRVRSVVGKGTTVTVSKHINLKTND